MKTFIHTIILALFAFTSIIAQENTNIPKGTYLFNEFTDGRALLKNKLYTNAKFNYDCVEQALHFMDRDQEMTMDNSSNIDTIYIQNRKFVPYQTRFLECIQIDKDQLLVDWKVKVHNIGKKGAMGMVTQSGGIDKVDVKRLQNNGFDRTGNEVYKIQYKNIYSISIDGKRKKFTDLKTFLKLFPYEQQESIKAFYKKEHIDIHEPQDVAKLVIFATKK